MTKFSGSNRFCFWGVILAVWLAPNFAVAAPPVNVHELSPRDIPVQVFAQVPDFAHIRISPNGRWLAASRQFRGRHRVEISDLMDPETPPVLLNFQGRFIDFLNWFNNDRLAVSLYYRGWRGGFPTTETRLLSVSRDGSRVVNLVQPSSRVVGSHIRRGPRFVPMIQNHVVDWLPGDPDYILMAYDQVTWGFPDVYRVNIKHGTNRRLVTTRRGIINWETDLEGKVRLGTGFIGGDRTIIFRDKSHGRWRTVYRKNSIDSPRFYPIDFSAEPDTLYVATDEFTGRLAVYLYNARTGVFGDLVFSHPTVDVERILIWNGRAVSVSYRVDEPEIHFFDAAAKQEQEQIDRLAPGTINRILSGSKNRQVLVVRATSSSEPGVYYLFNKAAGKLTQLGRAYHGLEPELMSPVRPIRYSARDGLTIPGYLTVPKDVPARQLPVVVLPHGGPGIRDDMTFNYWVQFLASRGYGVFQMNFRGSNGYGREFLQLGYREWGRVMQDDITDGVKWLIDEGIADPHRICIMGGSYGGYAAMMGAIKTPDLYQCAVSVNGVMDFPEFVRDVKNAPFSEQNIPRISAGKSEDQANSPAHNAASIRIPILLIHAKHDQSVDIKHAKRFVKQLEKAGVPYQLVIIDDANHGLGDGNHRFRMLAEIETFLARHLGPGAPYPDGSDEIMVEAMPPHAIREAERHGNDGAIVAARAAP